jgi:hypothetical protein
MNECTSTVAHKCWEGNRLFSQEGQSMQLLHFPNTSRSKSFVQSHQVTHFGLDQKAMFIGIDDLVDTQRSQQIQA